MRMCSVLTFLSDNLEYCFMWALLSIKLVLKEGIIFEEDIYSRGDLIRTNMVDVSALFESNLIWEAFVLWSWWLPEHAVVNNVLTSDRLSQQHSGRSCLTGILLFSRERGFILEVILKRLQDFWKLSVCFESWFQVGTVLVGRIYMCESV